MGQGITPEPKPLGQIAKDLLFELLPMDSDEKWESLAAAVVKAHEERKWRPIETAPKDGSLVDLWIPASAVGNLSGQPHRSTDCIWVVDHWELEIEIELPWLQCATHWRPAPEAPNA
jgi:hypothetical protein